MTLCQTSQEVGLWHSVFDWFWYESKQSLLHQYLMQSSVSHINVLTAKKSISSPYRKHFWYFSIYCWMEYSRENWVSDAEKCPVKGTHDCLFWKTPAPVDLLIVIIIISQVYLTDLGRKGVGLEISNRLSFYGSRWVCTFWFRFFTLSIEIKRRSSSAVHHVLNVKKPARGGFFITFTYLLRQMPSSLS